MSPFRLLPLGLALSLATACPARAAAPGVPARAAEALYEGKPLRHWLTELQADDALARDEAIEVLADAGPAARQAVLALERLLRDGPAGARRRAALAQGRREGAPVVRPLLISPNVRLHAARALWALEPEDKEARAALLAGLRDRVAVIRLLACDLLGTLGPDARAAVPHLRKALRDPDARVRVGAAESLARITGDRRASVLVLVEVVAQPGPLHVRLRAVGALGGMGPAADAALPALRKARADREPRLRPAASAALRLIAPEGGREAPDKR